MVSIKAFNLVPAGLFCAVAFAAQDVLAGGGQHGLQDDAIHQAIHDDPSAGLPQFDPSSYPSQIFWLAVTFVVMYLFFTTKTLPDISGVLENRRDHIQGDLETAEKLKKEAEETQAAYEEKLAAARAKASGAVSVIHDKMKQKAAEQNEAFRDKAAGELSALEKRLTKATNAAMKDMDSIVTTIAQEAAEKIAGIKADDKKVEKLVKAISTKKEAA